MEMIVTAWAEDCVVTGRASVGDEERLSDLVNAEGRVDLSGAVVEALEGGRRFDLDALSLGLDELCAVQLVGPRGDPRRRRWTVRRRIAAEVGPYVVTGSLHVLPGVNPLAAFLHRPRVVPLTDVVVEAASRDRALRWEVEVAGINQDRIGAIREVPEVGEAERGWLLEEEGSTD